MKSLVSRFLLVVFHLFLAGCSEKESLKPDCVKAEYVGVSDSYCGGPHKIKILAGMEKIEALHNNLDLSDNAIITTDVPVDLRKQGRIIYFTPRAAKPKICTANVIWYTEVIMENTSADSCK